MCCSKTKKLKDKGPVSIFRLIRFLYNGVLIVKISAHILLIATY